MTRDLPALNDEEMESLLAAARERERASG